MGTSNTGCFRVCILGSLFCNGSFSLQTLRQVTIFSMNLLKVGLKWMLPIKKDDARTSMGLVKAPKHETINQNKKLELMSTIMSLVVDQPTDTSNTNSYGVGSPFSLPPFDSLAPNSLPEKAPPYCFNPPLTPQTPSTAPIGTSYAPPTPVPYNIPRVLPGPNPPCTPYPPQVGSSPPSFIPGSPPIVPSPYKPIPSPPAAIPNPPVYIPSPPGFLPRPPVFLPPIVYPPLTGPPPRTTAPITALWCVAKPSVPDPIIQEAMNYACGYGVNCNSIQPSGPCFEPNSLFAHASCAFNSYFQRTKRAGGNCDFGDTAILVTVDPSSHGCHFEYS